MAGRAYDVVTRPDNVVDDCVRKILPAPGRITYWRLVARLAALCHDIGHIPFSHGPEEVLPKDWSHERLTFELIHSEEMSEIWRKIKIQPEDVAKIAVGPEKYGQYTKKSLSAWEAIISEIIVGDAFGVDRIDYLIRDSHHAGVPYGRIDQYRLIDCLRILPKSHESDEPTLGVEESGIYGAEALLLARYFMFSQLYFHHVRRIYDIHLIDYLRSFFEARGGYPTKFSGHVSMTDNEILSAMRNAATNPKAPGYDSAKRIITHDHFRRVYKRNPTDQAKNAEAGKAIYEALCDRYGKEFVRRDYYTQKRHGKDFPVLTMDGRIESSMAVSETLQQVPIVAVDCVYIVPDKREDATKFIDENRERIITPQKEEE